MRHGETYDVSPALFDGLMLNADWEAAEGFEEDAKKALDASAAEAQAANLGAPVGTTLEELEKIQQEQAETERAAIEEAKGGTQQPQPVAQAPASTSRRRNNTPEPAPDNGAANDGGGENS